MTVGGGFPRPPARCHEPSSIAIAITLILISKLKSVLRRFAAVNERHTRTRLPKDVNGGSLQEAINTDCRYEFRGRSLKRIRMRD
jgi:hypothetical protein